MTATWENKLASCGLVIVIKLTVSQSISCNKISEKQVTLLKGPAGNLDWFGMVKFGLVWF